MEREGQDLVAVEVPEAEPVAGDVVLKVAACAMNPLDDLVRRGRSSGAISPLVARAFRLRDADHEIHHLLQDRPSGNVVSVS